MSATQVEYSTDSKRAAMSLSHVLLFLSPLAKTHTWLVEIAALAAAMQVRCSENGPKNPSKQLCLQEQHTQERVELERDIESKPVRFVLRNLLWPSTDFACSLSPN